MRNNPIIVQKYGGACLEAPAKVRAVASSLADLHARRLVTGRRIALCNCGDRAPPAANVVSVALEACTAGAI
jgi:hypothetical protein